MGRGIVIALTAAMLFACGDSKLAKMDDYDLSESYGQCLDRKPTSPGKVQACENLRKECEQRKQDRGYFICRVQ